MKKKLSLEEMVTFVRHVAEMALTEERPFDAGVLVQDPDGQLSILMTPPLPDDREKQLITDLTAFLEEKAATHYVYMTALTPSTRVIYIYGATREGERLARRLDVDEDHLHEHPHEGHHQFMELFPHTLH